MVGRLGGGLGIRTAASGGLLVLPENGESVVADHRKIIGGGFPVGALITLTETATGLLQPGQHGTTFGGNPMAAAAALATIGVIERDHLLEAVQRTGEHLRTAIAATGHPLVAGVRGAGLLIAIELTAPVAPAAAQAALRSGFIVNPVAPDAIRLAPPFILTTEQADSLVSALPQILTEAQQ